MILNHSFFNLVGFVGLSARGNEEIGNESAKGVGKDRWIEANRDTNRTKKEQKERERHADARKSENKNKTNQ